MMNWLRGSLFLVLSAAAECGACASEIDTLSDRALRGVTVEDLAWLAGEWSTGNAESGSFQYVSCPRGDLMLGLQQDLKDGETRFFEYQRYVSREGGVVFVAQPRGADITGFALIMSADNRAIFENQLHDYPQRIELALDGTTLNARISGEINGRARASNWTWERHGDAPACTGP